MSWDPTERAQQLKADINSVLDAFSKNIGPSLSQADRIAALEAENAALRERFGKLVESAQQYKDAQQARSEWDFAHPDLYSEALGARLRNSVNALDAALARSEAVLAHVRSGVQVERTCGIVWEEEPFPGYHALCDDRVRDSGSGDKFCKFCGGRIEIGEST